MSYCASSELDIFEFVAITGVGCGLAEHEIVSITR